jgi:hypothetical protein
MPRNSQVHECLLLFRQDTPSANEMSVDHDHHLLWPTGWISERSAITLFLISSLCAIGVASTAELLRSFPPPQSQTSERPLPRSHATGIGTTP